MGGIKEGVEKDFNRLTQVLSKQKSEKIGSIYWGGIAKNVMYRDGIKMQKT